MKKWMVVGLVLFFIYSPKAFCFCTAGGSAFPACDTTIHEINREVFYRAMEEDNRALVDTELAVLAAGPKRQTQAFTGTLIMKKAGLGGSALTKLHLFKEGHKMLEAAIAQEPNNTEYRFLRLMIQENAPGFLGYKSDLEKDSEYIRKTYKSLPEVVQQAVLRYNKKSKVLKLDLS